MPPLKQWQTSGRAWELMLLTTLLAAAAIGLPALLPQAVRDPQTLIIKPTDAYFVHEWSMFGPASRPWVIVTSLLYALYLFMPNPFIQRLSLYLFDPLAPLIFTIITYVRVAMEAKARRVALPFIGQHPWDLVFWLVLAALLVALLVVFRAWREHRRWGKLKWDLVSPSARDGSRRQLAANFYPLVYPPHAYRICPDGLLILGWHYVMPIPLSAIESVRLERRANRHALLTNSAFLATSTKNILRLGIKGIRKPVFISPKKSSAFLLYLRLARSRLK